MENVAKWPAYGLMVLPACEPLRFTIEECGVAHLVRRNHCVANASESHIPKAMTRQPLSLPPLLALHQDADKSASCHKSYQPPKGQPRVFSNEMGVPPALPGRQSNFENSGSIPPA